MQIGTTITKNQTFAIISKTKNSHQLMQKLSAVGSVHQYQEIMIKKNPHYHHVNFFLNGCGSHFVFNGFIPKVNQMIRNTYRTIIPHLNAIQAKVHKLSCPQAF